MKKNIFIGFYIFALTIILLSLFLFFYNTNKVISIEEIPIKFTITNEGIGFDLNLSALTFGAITAGGSARREITIENKNDFNVKAIIALDRGIARFIQVERLVYINSSEKLNLNVSVITKINDTLGEYNGSLLIKTIRI